MHFHFDGREFNAAHLSLPLVEMAYRALRGDVGANALLLAAGVQIADTFGRLYFPPPALKVDAPPTAVDEANGG
jgi:hypothetical protein